MSMGRANAILPEGAVDSPKKGTGAALGGTRIAADREEDSGFADRLGPRASWVRLIAMTDAGIALAGLAAFVCWPQLWETAATLLGVVTVVFGYVSARAAMLSRPHVVFLARTGFAWALLMGVTAAQFVEEHEVTRDGTARAATFTTFLGAAWVFVGSIALLALIARPHHRRVLRRHSIAVLARVFGPPLRPRDGTSLEPSEDDPPGSSERSPERTATP